MEGMEIQRNNFELGCVGLDGKKWRESQQAKLFVDINEKSKRISKLLLYDLYELIGIPEIRVEVVKKLAMESKIFKGKIKLHKKDKGEISLVSFVNTSPMGRLISEKSGELGILFRERYGNYPDYNKEKIRERCKKFYFKIFEDYFGLIQTSFPKEWKENKNYVLSTDRGIRVFLRLLKLLYKYNLINGKKMGDPEIFKMAISALKGFDFSVQDLKGKYFGEGGADLFLESLKEHIQKTIPDFFPKENRKEIHNIGIEYGEKEKANKLICSWLGLLGKEIFGELPYIDSTIFYYLEKLPLGSNIKLFVSNIHGENEFKENCEKLKQKGYKIKVKRITRGPFQKGQNKIAYLHGRWIGGNFFEIEPGYDLMKGSIGNKKDRMKLYKTENSERIIEFKERWNVLSKFKDVLIEDIF